jgi:HEAT repeat protein
MLLVAAGLSAGCAATEEAPKRAPPPIVKPADLPARHQEILEAWKKGGAAWDFERDAVRADPELSRFVVDNLTIELVQAYDRSRLARVAQQRGPFERAQDELVLMADQSTPVLVQFMTLKDDIVAFLAADTLARIGVPAIEPTLKLLENADPKNRMRAADLLGKLPHAGGGETKVLEALAARVESDREWIVRGQSAQALGARGARHAHKGFAMGVLGRALNDEDISVAAAAAEALGVLGEPRAIPKLVDALAASSAAGKPMVVDAIQDALARLSRDNTRRDVNQWRAWWREHEAGFAKPLTTPGS